jgi:hypothetical protein
MSTPVGRLRIDVRVSRRCSFCRSLNNSDARKAVKTGHSRAAVTGDEISPDAFQAIRARQAVFTAEGGIKALNLPGSHIPGVRILASSHTLPNNRSPRFLFIARMKSALMKQYSPSRALPAATLPFPSRSSSAVLPRRTAMIRLAGIAAITQRSRA